MAARAGHAPLRQVALAKLHGEVRGVRVGAACYTAAARAVENIVYVALAGNTGNLRANTYLLNYAESVVLTPSDFGFPPSGVAAAAEPGVESVAIADLDFASLAAMREMGSVRPLQDLRLDIYDLSAIERVRRITVI
jgi:predicted amidohydrolase